VEKKDGVVVIPNSKGNAVYIDKTQATIQEGVRLVNGSAKEELTREEEAKFYRKVFKTSLL
jgi:hypothetical protein